MAELKDMTDEQLLDELNITEPMHPHDRELRDRSTTAREETMSRKKSQKDRDSVHWNQVVKATEYLSQLSASRIGAKNPHFLGHKGNYYCCNECPSSFEPGQLEILLAFYGQYLARRSKRDCA